jgi:hypothetical protein
MSDTDTAPDIQTSAPPMDPSILGGGGDTAPTYTGPTGGDTGIPPTLGSQFEDNATPPPAAPVQQGNGSASNPIQLPPKSSDNMTGAAAPTNSGTRQSAWMNVVKGALFGMMAGAGTKNIGTGMSAGLEKVNSTQQQDIENQRAQQEMNMKKQQLQFESVRAADSHINALDEHTRAQQDSKIADLQYTQKAAEYQNFLQDNFGIEPDLSFTDNNTQSHAGMQTLARGNGGQIPPVATIMQPSGKGWGSGTVSVYSPTQEQMRTNANAYRELINTSRKVEGLPDIDNATFNSLGFKGQRDAAQKAIDSLKPTPSYNLDKNSPNYLPVVLAQKQQQLAQYQKHKDINGNPDADPAVEKQLQNGINYLQASWDSTNKAENEAENTKNISTAVTKLESSPDELAKPGAKASIQALLADSRTTPADHNRLMSLLPKVDVAQNQVINMKRREALAQQSVSQGDPEVAGKLLANRSLTLDELKSRQVTPQFITKAVAAAQNIDPNFKAAESAAQASIAKSPANQQFFGNTDSLLIKGGTIDQLAGASYGLPNDYRLPALNKGSDWESAALGFGSTARFAASVLGVADDYAKVMGGQQGSDTARAQVLALFKPDMSKTQIDAAIDQVRKQVRSQRAGRIGSNPYLKDMYPDPQNYDAPQQQQSTDPASKFGGVTR